MGFKIPLLGMEPIQIKEWVDTKLLDPTIQKRCVLVIVSIALLLDNMLYMVIVPIIPEYFRNTGVYTRVNCTPKYIKAHPNGPLCMKKGQEAAYEGEDAWNGYLFASKAAVQIFINPISGTIIDHIGYELPMVFGLTIMFTSTALFSVGEGYTLLFLARSLQGVGSAFADTSGLAMIADRFQDEQERSKALGIALAFISFGSLVAPPFGGTLYNNCGKFLPFILLSLTCLFDALLVWYVIRPKRKVNEVGGVEVKGTPIYRLLMDPMIAVCAGALVMANVSLAFLEPTMTTWLEDQPEWKVDPADAGNVWLPAFFPHVGGVYLTIVLMRKYPNHPWLIAAIGLATEGLSCLVLPFSPSFIFVVIPLCTICFGVALIDTSLLPMLGYLVDTRHVSVYGSVYAIADMSYSMAYALGPIVAGQIKEKYGFVTLNMFIFVTNVGYVPMFYFLKKAYVYGQFQEELATKAGIDDDDGACERMTAVSNSEYSRAAYGAMADTETRALATGADYGYGDDNAPVRSFGVPKNIQDKLGQR
jgi:DHA1 family vesicular acetylcholine transporter-like MFS transporter 3